MTAKNIIEQIEKMFGRQPEQYMFQLINDALDDIAAQKQHRTVSKVTDLKKHDRGDTDDISAADITWSNLDAGDDTLT